MFYFVVIEIVGDIVMDVDESSYDCGVDDFFLVKKIELMG